MRKMKKILLAVISLLPLLSYGQSMKISPKQIEAGLNGQTIITRSGVNVLDSLKWTDVSGVPGNLEMTSNKVINLNSPNNTTYPTTQAVTTWVNSQGFLNSIPTLQSVTTSGNTTNVSGTNGSVLALTGNGVNITPVTNTSAWGRSFQFNNASGIPIGGFGAYGTAQNLSFLYINSSTNSNQNTNPDVKIASNKVGINLPSGNNQMPNSNLDVRGNAAIVGVSTSTADILNINSGTPGLFFSISNNSGGAGFLTRLTSTTNSTVGGIVENTYNPHSNAGFSSGGYIHGIADSTGSGPLTSGNHTQWRNGLNSIMTLGYDGSLTLPKLAGTGNRMVIANSGGLISTQAIPSLTETDPVYTADKGHLIRTDLNSTGYLFNGATSATDLKNITNNSVIRVNLASTNAPTNATTSGGTLQNFTYATTGYRTQTYQDFTGHFLINSSNNNVWSGWKELLGDGDNISRFNNNSGYYKPSDTLTILATKHNLLNIGTSNLEITSPSRYLTYKSGVTPANLTIGDTASITGNYISLSPTNSIIKNNSSSMSIINNGGGINILDSSAIGTNIYSGYNLGINTGAAMILNSTQDMSVNSFNYNLMAGGDVNVTSSNGGVNLSSASPIKLSSQYSPVQLYSGSGSPVQISTDGGSNGVNIFTHNVTGFKNNEMPNESGTFLLDADTATFLATKNNIPTVNNATLTLTTTVYGAINTQTWTSNSATNKNWAVNVAGTDITTGLNVHTGVLTTQSSTGNDDSVQLLSKINDKGYLQPTTGTGVNTGGGFAATAQTEAFNSTYIDLNDGTYTLYIVAGGNPSGGDIKLVDPNEIPDRIIRIVNTSGATGTFINAPIVGLTSSSVTTINSGKYIVIQSVIDPSSGGRMWAQVGGNY